MKANVYSFLVGDNGEHKKVKDVNTNVVATISNNEYKDILLNNKCLRYSISRIESKDYRIGTYEIHKISLLYFDEKIYIQNKGYDGLSLGYQRELEKTVIVITILKIVFWSSILL